MKNRLKNTYIWIFHQSMMFSLIHIVIRWRHLKKLHIFHEMLTMKGYLVASLSAGAASWGCLYVSCNLRYCCGYQAQKRHLGLVSIIDSTAQLIGVSPSWESFSSQVSDMLLSWKSRLVEECNTRSGLFSGQYCADLNSYCNGCPRA